MQTRGLAGAVFNAAKEVALDSFIDGKLGFMQMAAVVETTRLLLYTSRGG